jgi:acetyl-CoA acetyltransferase
MLQLEALGLCAKGEAPKFVRERDLTVEGDMPLNTNGGMLSLGQAGAAGGFLGLTEAVRQLTGEALGALVPGAKAGVVSGYGTVNYDRGLCSGAVVLTAEEKVA